MNLEEKDGTDYIIIGIVVTTTFLGILAYLTWL